MAVAGINSAYGDTAAPLAQVLTTTGITLINTVLKTQCSVRIFATLRAHHNASDVFRSTSTPAVWQTLYNENDAATFTAPGPAPVLIVHGDADPIIPASTSATLAGELCTLTPPQHLERWLYVGLDHISIINATTNSDINQWMSDRFADEPWPDPYTPTGNGTTAVAQTNGY